MSNKSYSGWKHWLREGLLCPRGYKREGPSLCLLYPPVSLFSHEAMETQRGQVTSPRSHSSEEAHLNTEIRLRTLSPVLLPLPPATLRVLFPRGDPCVLWACVHRFESQLWLPPGGATWGRAGQSPKAEEENVNRVHFLDIGLEMHEGPKRWLFPFKLDTHGDERKKSHKYD